MKRATLCGGWKDLGNPLASILRDAFTIPAPFLHEAIRASEAVPCAGVGTLVSPGVEVIAHSCRQLGSLSARCGPQGSSTVRNRAPEPNTQTAALLSSRPALSNNRDTVGAEPCLPYPGRGGSNRPSPFLCRVSPESHNDSNLTDTTRARRGASISCGCAAGANPRRRIREYGRHESPRENPFLLGLFFDGPALLESINQDLSYTAETDEPPAADPRRVNHNAQEGAFA